MAIINGTSITVLNGASLIANSISNTVTINMATRDTSNKDSGIYASREGGRLDVSISCDGLVAVAGYKTLLTLIVARAALTINVKDGATTVLSGSFLLTSVEQSAPDQENVTYNCSFEYAGGTLTL
jgi:predicted secreted protein